jgi:hypothetical protein
MKPCWFEPMTMQPNLARMRPASFRSRPFDRGRDKGKKSRRCSIMSQFRCETGRARRRSTKQSSRRLG